jgi:hypothetical protein
MKSLLGATFVLFVFAATPASGRVGPVPTRQAVPPEFQLTMTGRAYLPASGLELRTQPGQTEEFQEVVVTNRLDEKMTAQVATFTTEWLKLSVFDIDARGKRTGRVNLFSYRLRRR